VDVASVSKLGGLLIPIVAILGGILLPVVIIFLVLQSRQQQREKLYETVKYFADRGMPVPAELLDPPRHEPRFFGTLRFRAMTLIGVGVGLVVMFSAMGLDSLWGIGALLVCIGGAQLVALRLDGNERSKAPPGGHDGQPR
jgi:hypothetical protein